MGVPSVHMCVAQNIRIIHHTWTRLCTGSTISRCLYKLNNKWKTWYLSVVECVNCKSLNVKLEKSSKGFSRYLVWDNCQISWFFWEFPTFSRSDTIFTYFDYHQQTYIKTCIAFLAYGNLIKQNKKR